MFMFLQRDALHQPTNTLIFSSSGVQDTVYVPSVKFDKDATFRTGLRCPGRDVGQAG